jgi:hypothetical protein
MRWRSSSPSSLSTPDVEVGDQDDDPAAPVGPTDPYVMELVPLAQGEDPDLVDLVVADPGVGSHRVRVGVRGCFGQGAEGLSRRDHASGRVGPGLVVVTHEMVDLPLELGDGPCRVLFSAASA